MKKIIYITLFILTGTLFYGCEDFLDVNKNLDKAVFSTPEQQLPVILFYASQLQYDHAEYNMYLAQAFTTGGKSQTGAYAYKSGWEFLSMNRHPQWRRHYYDIGVNVMEMNKLAEQIKSYNYILIARTVRLMSTLFTTDAFGDMPLSKSYTSVAPKYDTQEEVYAWMLKESDELIALYDNKEWTQAGTNKKIDKAIDRIYGGDLEKWKRFTYALKARILLRKLPNWDNNAQVCQAIINNVDSAMVNGWDKSVGDVQGYEPDYIYPGGSGELSCPWGPGQPAIGGWESRKNELDKAIPTKFLCLNMMGAKPGSAFQGVLYGPDPRLEQIMVARSGPADDPKDTIRYLDANIGMGISYKEVNFPDLYTKTRTAPTVVFAKDNGYISLMTKEELLLMKAEASFWKGDVQAAYDNTILAVRANMGRYNVLENKMKKYLALARYLPQPSLVPGEGFNIGHLMRQKYICMYMQPEIWTDMRRYNYSNNTNKITYRGTIIYPQLRRPYNLYEPYWLSEKDATGKPKEIWIQRINYDPETEEKYNRAELERLGAYRNYKWLQKPMVWAVYNSAVQ